MPIRLRATLVALLTTAALVAGYTSSAAAASYEPFITIGAAGCST